jgi:hypothetical protein
VQKVIYFYKKKEWKMNGITQKDGYQIVDFPRVREIVIDVMVPAEKKHMIHVLFEADVTDVRKYLKKKKSEGESVPSLTSFIIKCVADAAMTNKRIAALRFARYACFMQCRKGD